MTLPAGTRLGAYEVLAPLGAGGMGEVYRARDARLGRDVAIKVLPGDLASDAGRLKRFEKEARSASALNHPNIVTVHDTGTTNGVSWIAMELVEGKTLRELLFAGAMPVTRLVALAAQISEGLARAHDAGIVHRDLKPENVMVTKDGRAKILDFGLAKQRTTTAVDDAFTPTETATGEGALLGTVGYMSPEQASGHSVDYRSDQFSFGSVLYEMATGKRAFSRNTAPQTLTAIIQDDAEPVESANPQVPAPLRWIVERCLAKDPDRRYASTRDLARDIASLPDRLAGGAASSESSRGFFASRRQSVLTAALALAVLALGFLLVARSLRSGSPPAPRFRQVTFEEQGIMTGRFAADGETFVYGAWRGDGPDLFLARVGLPESRPLGIPETAIICSISERGQMAFLMKGGDIDPGTLAQAALTGGAPRTLLENVWEADWSPGGDALAVLRRVDGKDRLEYPIGRVLHERAGTGLIRSAIRGCRVSPKGNRIAIIEDERLTLVDTEGEVTRLPQLGDCSFFGWSPRGDEVWYSRIKGGATELRAVTPRGRDRQVVSLAGDFQLVDVSRSGRVLLEKGTNLIRVFGRLRGETGERSLSHLAGTSPVDLSADGRRLLFNEIESYGTTSTIYLRDGGSPPVRIGEGYARALSPDGKWVIATESADAPSGILLLPTGAGSARRLPNGGLGSIGAANWLPDGTKIVFAANASGEKPRLYLQDVSGGQPRSITPQGIYLPNIGGSVVSPDGTLVVGIDEANQAWLYPIDGGEPREVRGLEPKRRPEFPIQWTEDGRRLYVRRPGFPGVFLVDPFTGERKEWLKFEPDPGFLCVAVVISRDGTSYARKMHSYSSNLFVLDGVQ